MEVEDEQAEESGRGIEGSRRLGPSSSRVEPDKGRNKGPEPRSGPGRGNRAGV